MVRLFETHRIRPHYEAEGLWEFTPLTGPLAGRTQKVAVPSCWETYPGFESFRGRAKYETNIHTSGGNLRLVCKGVSHTARVWLDGQPLGGHYNAYTPFALLAPNLPAGEHRLCIEASNEFGPDSALHIPNDYESYGGITRPVVVEKVADVYLDWLHITPKRGRGGWRLELEARVCNLADVPHTARVAASVLGGEFMLEPAELKAGGSALAYGVIEVGEADEWAPEHPALHLLAARLYLDEEQSPSDDLIQRFGLREIEIKGKDLLLNGRPLRIKGVCRHEAHALFGSALPFAALDADVNQMLDLGCNAVRTSHYPNDELFLDLCDEKGLLVWEEGHVRSFTLEEMQHPLFAAQESVCIEEMITRHYNHPSIILWGILNECASHCPEGRAFYEQQYAQIAGLDQSRPRSHASMMAERDICMDLPEVCSYNIYPGWYLDVPVKEYVEKMPCLTRELSGKEKPTIISEIGAGGIYGYRTPRAAKWSEERQSALVAEQLDAILPCPDITGVFLWQFCDCRVTEERWFNLRPKTQNNKGLVDEYRRPKLVYEAVKRRFTALGDYKDEA